MKHTEKAIRFSELRANKAKSSASYAGSPPCFKKAVIDLSNSVMRVNSELGGVRYMYLK